nr:MAG TPA: hypothetical protein [Caudoviricetes sp.]
MTPRGGSYFNFIHKFPPVDKTSTGGFCWRFTKNNSLLLEDFS